MDKHTNAPSVEQVARVARLAARLMLESGGETYRAEDTANHIAHAFGLKTDIIAFPTGLTMTLTGNSEVSSVIARVDQTSTDLTKLDRDVIFRLVWKREQMMTTGVGGQLALPHIRINDIVRPFVIVGVCENPINDYQGQDDQPVRVIVFTVAPDEDQESYLQLLSSISRRLRNPELISELIGAAGNTVKILEILQREDA